MNYEDLQDLLKDADHERIEGYMKMFDRILLYSMAVNIMPDEAKEEAISRWEEIIKKSINLEATKITNLLEGSPAGRMAKYRKDPDGEDHRLHCLKQWDIARQIASANLKQSKEDGDEDYHSGSEF